MQPVVSAQRVFTLLAVSVLKSLDELHSVHARQGSIVGDVNALQAFAASYSDIAVSVQILAVFFLLWLWLGRLSCTLPHIGVANQVVSFAANGRIANTGAALSNAVGIL